MSRITNSAGITIIKDSEGLVLAATKDPGGIWTIGYGHATGVYAGEIISETQADQLLAQDLATFERAISSLCNVTSSNEFSAMVSLSFNIGVGAFRSSTVLRDHIAGNKTGAADAFLLWEKAHVDGQLVTLPGLVTRRQKERALYLTPDAPPAPPPAETVLDTIVDSAGKTHQIIDRVISTSSIALSGATVSAFLALALLASTVHPEKRIGFDWNGTTFYFDRNLHPVRVK